MSNYIIQNGELMHYGVPGMKWGVRRSRPSPGRFMRLKKRKLTKEEINKTNDLARPKKRKLSEVPDDELKAKIARLDLEKRYKELSKQVDPPKSTRGKDFAIRVIEKIGENTLVNIGTQAANKGLGTAINKIFGVDSDDVVNRIVNPNKGQSDKK